MDPINITVGNIQVCALNADDIPRFADMANEVFEILSDDTTLKFIPEKKLKNALEAEKWLQSSVINYYTKRNYIHLIRSKESGSILGMVDILSPELIQDHYRLKDYPYFIEFYIKRQARNSSLMTRILPCIVEAMTEQGITKISAVADKRNVPAKRVLAKSGFKYRTKFDIFKDLYETFGSTSETLQFDG